MAVREGGLQPPQCLQERLVAAALQLDELALEGERLDGALDGSGADRGGREAPLVGSRGRNDAGRARLLALRRRGRLLRPSFPLHRRRLLGGGLLGRRRRLPELPLLRLQLLPQALQPAIEPRLALALQFGQLADPRLDVPQALLGRLQLLVRHRAGRALL
ncbi:MAG: hypothetical protein P8Y27_12385, partial [Chromatiaceae bacterium]